MRRRDSRCDRLTGVDVAPLPPVDDQSGQYARRIGTSVNADAIGTLLDLAPDGVPVDDDKTMIAVIREEWLPDPSQVRLRLLGQLDSRTNSGVDEEVVAEATGIGETAQELDVRGRNQRADCSYGRVRSSRRNPQRVAAIAPQALGTAELQPAGDQLRLAAENAQQHLLVVAEQKDRANSVAPVIAQPVDYARRVRPAVDKVAEKHDQRSRGTMRFHVAVDLPEQLLEQIEAAMHVANHVGDLAFRPAWRAPFR